MDEVGLVVTWWHVTLTNSLIELVQQNVYLQLVSAAVDLALSRSILSGRCILQPSRTLPLRWGLLGAEQPRQLNAGP